jgi:type I restriction enzyme S subunit
MMGEEELGQLLEVVIDHRGQTPKKLGGVDFTDCGVPVVSAIHIKNGRINWNERRRYVPQWMFEKWMPVRLRAGDVLLTSEAPLGEVAQVEDDGDLVLSQRLFALRGRPDCLDSSYLRYYLQSHEGQQRLSHRASGTTVSGIRQAELLRIKIPLPQIEDQRRIAGVLGALDALIDLDRRLRESILSLAEAIYQHAIDGSSNAVSLGDAGTWYSGGTPDTSNPAYWHGELPWVSASSLKGFFVGTSDRTLTDLGAQHGTRVVPRGTILFVVRGMSLKTEFRLGVAQRDVAFGQDCKAVRVHDWLPKSIVAVGLLANAEKVRELVDEASHGTGRLATDRMKRLIIRLPSRHNIESIERTISTLLALGADAEQQARSISKARDQLLPLLVSGRLRVKDVAA